MLFQTLTLYASVILANKIRIGIADGRPEQIERSEQSEQSDVDLIETYKSALGKRQKRFLSKIAFSSGKNYYLQLQHQPAITGMATDDSIQTQGGDPATSDSIPFQEIKDEEVEPLISEPQHGEHFRLLFVYLACDPNSGLRVLQCLWHCILFSGRE